MVLNAFVAQMSFHGAPRGVSFSSALVRGRRLVFVSQRVSLLITVKAVLTAIVTECPARNFLSHLV